MNNDLVLVAGAGPVGLTMALALKRQDINRPDAYVAMSTRLEDDGLIIAELHRIAAGG